MSYFITTTDAARAARWLALFGTEILPVLSPSARWVWHDGLERPCYDLALSELTQAQRDRLAAYAAGRTRRPYAEIRAEINAAVSWPIRAAGCVVVEAESPEAAETRPPLFAWAGRAWNRLPLAG